MNKLLIMLLIGFLFGCSTAKVQPHAAAPALRQPGVESNEKVKTINVYIYSTRHPDKSQPMLITVISEPEKLQDFETTMKNYQLGVLPATEVKEVFYFQLEYVENGVSEYREFLYVRTMGNEAYVKAFKLNQENSHESFDENSLQALLTSAGTNEWHCLSGQLPI
ncbi:hypothetical protein ACFFK0_18720 [Paenibacillus chartarius]|uniref:Lipoprotein n=1 Tax=Paenibacillus chartarius TaxID=747481 RepID=A0ABV6DP88_9BACL